MGRRVFAGLTLIVVGVGLGLLMLVGMAMGHGFSDEPASYWSAGDTVGVLVFGGAFIPGVWLVVSGLSDEGARVTWGITSIIVGATYSLVAGSLVGRDDALSTGHSPVPVPTGEYVFAALVGGIPLLVGVALLVYGPITDSRHRVGKARP